MTEIERSTNAFTAPHYAGASSRAKAAAAAAAVLISTSLLGGLLVIFETQAVGATGVQIARQSAPAAAAMAAIHPRPARS